MIWTLLLVSTWPFWFFVILLLGCELFLIEKNEDPWAVTISTVCFLAFVLLFTDWKPWHSITVGDLIIYGAAYLIIGALYALFPRWAAYVKDKSKEFETTHEAATLRWKEMQKDSSLNSVNYNLKTYKDFDEFLRDEYKFPPMPWDKGVRSKLYMYMIYWPLSALWLVLGKTAKYVFDFALSLAKDKMAAISYAIAKSHFSGK